MADEPFTLTNARSVAESWTPTLDEWPSLEQREDEDDDEDDDERTNRLVREGADVGRHRQCSIGWHDECSDRGRDDEDRCTCPCHKVTVQHMATTLRWLRDCLRHAVPDSDTDQRERPSTIEGRMLWAADWLDMVDRLLDRVEVTPEEGEAYVVGARTGGAELQADLRDDAERVTEIGRALTEVLSEFEVPAEHNGEFVRTGLVRREVVDEWASTLGGGGE